MNAPPSRIRLQHGAEVSKLQLNTAESISSLQFQIKSLTSEMALLRHEKESSAASFERLIQESALQHTNLKTSFDALHSELTLLKSKHENELQVATSKTSALLEELESSNSEKRHLELENSRLERLIQEVYSEARQYRSSAQVATEKCEKASAEFEQAHKQLEDSSNENLELQKRLGEYASQVSTKILHSTSTALHKKIEQLQLTNSKLQIQIDRLMQRKFTTALLSEKNATLSTEVARLKTVNKDASQRELELLQRLSDYESVVAALKLILPESLIQSGVPVGSNVEAYLATINEIRCQNMVLTNECKSLKQVEFELSEQLSQWKQVSKPEWERERASLQSLVQEKEERAMTVERQVVLHKQEIHFLRQQLEQNAQTTQDEQREEGTATQNENDTLKQESVYLHHITSDKLIEEYRAEIEALNRKLAAVPPTREAESSPRQLKRARIDDTSFLLTPKLSAEDVIKLEVREKLLVSELQSANQQLTDLRKVIQLKNTVKTVEFAENPANVDQLVKRRTLDLLRKENEEIIARYVTPSIGRTNSEQDELVVPLSVFARQEDDKALLRLETEKLALRINRLRASYTAKSKDILTIISRYFGYNVQFLSNPINPSNLSSRLKLVSRYMPPNTPCYLTIDLTTTAMKAYGDFDFKNLYQELLSSYTQEQIPCFLSALNLKLYEIYCLDKVDTESTRVPDDARRSLS